MGISIPLDKGVAQYSWTMWAALIQPLHYWAAVTMELVLPPVHILMMLELCAHHVSYIQKFFSVSGHVGWTSTHVNSVIIIRCVIIWLYLSSWRYYCYQGYYHQTQSLYVYAKPVLLECRCVCGHVSPRSQVSSQFFGRIMYENRERAWKIWSPCTTTLCVVLCRVLIIELWPTQSVFSVISITRS